MSAALAPLTVKDIDTSMDEPRIQDLRLAERLGMANPYKIRELIDRNLEELRRYGPLVAYRVANDDEPRAVRDEDPLFPTVGNKDPLSAKVADKKRRRGFEYHLNQGQSLLICMFSRTPVAADVRQEVITVFLACQRGEDGGAGLRRMNPRAPIQAADIVARLRRERDPNTRRILHAGLDRLCQEIGTDTPPLDELGHDAPAPSDIAAPFFAGLERLTELGVRWNHARRPDRMAVNLKEAASHFSAHGIKVAIDTPLRTALKDCRDPAFVGYLTVNSDLTGRSVRCWVFKAPASQASP